MALAVGGPLEHLAPWTRKPPPDTESEAELQARLVREAERIAEADASIAAGYYATSAEVKAWIDSLGTEHPLPVPPQSTRVRSEPLLSTGCPVGSGLS